MWGWIAQFFRRWGDPPTDTLELGRWGERRAARWLWRRGWRILERNVALKNGEIDLVTEDPEGELVFVEVRTRRAPPSERPVFDQAKAERMERGVQSYLQRRRNIGHRYRCDVIRVNVDPTDNNKVHFEYTRAAF